jgi:hypothetical protein
VSEARDATHFSEVRRHLASRFGRLPTNAWFILQAAVAAGIAYFLAANLLGHEQPFFTPTLNSTEIAWRLGISEEAARALVSAASLERREKCANRL